MGKLCSKEGPGESGRWFTQQRRCWLWDCHFGLGDDDVADDDVPETDRWQQVPDSRVAVGRAPDII